MVALLFMRNGSLQLSTALAMGGKVMAKLYLQEDECFILAQGDMG